MAHTIVDSTYTAVVLPYTILWYYIWYYYSCIGNHLPLLSGEYMVKQWVIPEFTFMCYPDTTLLYGILGWLVYILLYTTLAYQYLDFWSCTSDRLFFVAAVLVLPLQSRINCH